MYNPYKNLLKFFAGSLFLILFSCSEDKDKVSPEILITAPEKTSYDVFDTLHVRADITDDNKVVKASSNIRNESLDPVADGEFIEPEKKELQYSSAIIIDDMRLPTGKYYLTVSASDGNNETNAYRELHITAAPKKLKKTLFFTKPSNSTVNVKEVDSTGGIHHYFSSNTDYGGSIVSSYNQFFVIMGRNKGDMVAYETESKREKWRALNPNGDRRFFNSINHDSKEHLTTVSFATGNIKTYKENSSVFSNYDTAASNREPKETLLYEDFLIAEQEPLTNAKNKLAVYHKAGAFEKSKLIKGDVISLNGKNGSEVFVLMN
ncbi:MAG: hypothetical protein ABEH43_08590, partial [Flavobacteriales bacterium]